MAKLTPRIVVSDLNPVSSEVPRPLEFPELSKPASPIRYPHEGAVSNSYLKLEGEWTDFERNQLQRAAGFLVDLLPSTPDTAALLATLARYPLTAMDEATMVQNPRLEGVWVPERERFEFARSAVLNFFTVVALLAHEGDHATRGLPINPTHAEVFRAEIPTCEATADRMEIMIDVLGRVTDSTPEERLRWAAELEVRAVSNRLLGQLCKVGDEMFCTLVTACADLLRIRVDKMPTPNDQAPELPPEFARGVRGLFLASQQAMIKARFRTCTADFSRRNADHFLGLFRSLGAPEPLRQLVSENLNSWESEVRKLEELVGRMEEVSGRYRTITQQL